ncbi:uncharacterized protein LY79DRAFT_538693 [Colletotrichum navitas]|uniref:Nucleoside phosphorylase domain-containing protein n=1 Tax=Colletotrichum navitas TaxID=681940 RepID=A0AAD8Q9W2_9PEZI|nr:uncharacterized protein LY79DRAFT_538693 [Colletotrichum navitas]KAK1598284.1 hypothetical protein LY79DRAFT_538693 [Colletotrichum navitas]
MTPNGNSHHHCSSGHASWVHPLFRLITPVEETCLTRRQVLVYEAIPCALDVRGKYPVKSLLWLLIMTAVKAMLDRVHPPLPRNSDEDKSIRWGHMGNNVAATIANQVRSTFPAIWFGLMMGIGGGWPSAKQDVKLGDVVVSKLGRNDDSVIRCDFGRTVGEGRFVRNSTGKKR